MGGMSTPTDAEMLDVIRQAKHKLISDIAQGKAAKEIQMPQLQVVAQDSEKLLDKLQKMENHYVRLTADRNSFVLR